MGMADGVAPSSESERCSHKADSFASHRDGSSIKRCPHALREGANGTSPIAAFEATVRRGTTHHNTPVEHDDRRRQNVSQSGGRKDKTRKSCSRTDSGRVLDAAALQDSLLRNLKLDIGGLSRPALFVAGGGGLGLGARRRRRRPAPDRASRPAAQQGEGTAWYASGRQVVPASRGAPINHTWTCECCSAVNNPSTIKSIDNKDNSDSNNCSKGDTSCCSICMHPQARIESSGNGCGTRGNGGHGRRRLTLAQMRGLEEMPEPLLTAGEWSIVEKEALARGDEEYPCPICREPFQGESQVILSCSHVFHRACLASFERFLRARERSCPLCRKVDYQKRTTQQGAVAWRQRCARRLQSAFRGYKVRREYCTRLRQLYTGGGGSPRRRRKFLSEQAAERAGKLAAAVESRGDSIDRLFDELDRGLAFSRQVFGPPPTSGVETLVEEQFQEPSINSMTTAEEAPNDVEKMWENAWKMARARGADECPICMCGMEKIPSPLSSSPKPTVNSAADHQNPESQRDSIRRTNQGTRENNNAQIGVGSGGVGRQGGRGNASGGDRKRAQLLLSCSHVFHDTCLRAFESFNIYEVNLCPVCRQAYDSVNPCEDARHIHNKAVRASVA